MMQPVKVSSPTRRSESLSHQTTDVNGATLHYVEQGQGPSVVLLHGFPEFWFGWRHQIPALADAGFRVIAPDLRGFNLSSKPEGVSSYRLETLGDDIIALIQKIAGPDKVTLVGHDWGGTVAYQVAMKAPQLLSQLIILNAPHPVQYQRALRTFEQLRKAWYILFFQIPGVSERFLSKDDFQNLRRALTGGAVKPGIITAAELETYVEAYRQPGALTSALNYYRAAVRTRPVRATRIDVPTHVLYGAQDRFLTPFALEPDSKWVSNATVTRIEEAGHFVQAEAPERVNEFLIERLLQVVRGVRENHEAH